VGYLKTFPVARLYRVGWRGNWSKGNELSARIVTELASCHLRGVTDENHETLELG
jgi:hypothetical protein